MEGVEKEEEEEGEGEVQRRGNNLYLSLRSERFKQRRRRRSVRRDNRLRSRRSAADLLSAVT